MRNLILLGFVTCLIASCSSPQGDKATVTDAKDVATATTIASYKIDAAASKVLWTGYKKIGKKHTGTINIKSGELAVSGNNIESGKVTIDMSTVSATDVEGPKKQKLDGHLQAPDFFDVASFPNAKFALTGVNELIGDTHGNTHTISGNLTIKDVTKNVSFPAKVTVGEGTVTASAPEFLINRTDFGLQYGAERFVEGLAKDHIINEEFGIALEISANK